MTLDIQSYTYEDRQELLPALAEALAQCGGWVLDRRVISGTTLELQVEVGLESAVEMYAAMVQAGLELTRTGHAALTELCLREQYLGGCATGGETVAIRLEVSFPGELPLEQLMTRAPMA